MGTIASQETPESRTPSEEGGARAAILGAARKVAERDGVLEMTLTGVAKEACVAPTDIYAFFTSKNDLLQAVVADDLANLAKTMRQRLDPSTAPNADTIPLQFVTNQAADAEQSQPQEQQVPPMQATETLHTDKQDTPDTTNAVPVQETPRRFPVVQARRESSRTGTADANAATGEAIAQLREAVTKLESRPVDQWLERRLREFERTLYALQHNQNHRATSNSSEQGLQSLRESIEAVDMRHAMAAEESTRSVSERFHEFDKRLRETSSEVQVESLLLARRITALENLAFASRPEMVPPPAEFAPVAESAPPPVTEAPPAASDDAAHESDESAPSYLTTARRSAQAAAARANEEFRQRPAQPQPNKTMFYAAWGSFAVFVLMLAGAAFMLRNSSMNPEPLHVAAKPAPVRVMATAGARRGVVNAARMPQKSSQTNLLKLAEMGDPSAEFLVGLDYLEGKGVPKNEAAAVDWLSRAAAKGQPVAQYDLGALYADGRGVHADPVQAFQWFGAAALHGNRRAMHFLAIAYAEGIGTAKNLPEAARWFERSAALGAVNSQFNVAVLYERGLGLPQSLTTAYKWYAIAAAQGDTEARARVTALASTLKPDDLAAAKSAAEAFKPEPLDAAANLPPKLPS